jgi:phage shock protein PspC (stress-responsive transcriptional regulator)
MADETTSDQTPELPHQVPELPDPTVPGTGPTADDPPTGAAPDDNPTDPTPDRAPDRAPAKLRRDTEHRLLGGVAAGVARYLDVDVVFVRVAFAVLTVLGGSGALIYLAAWLLIPADDEEHPLVQQWAGRRPPRRSLVVIVVGVVLGLIALSDLFSNGPWRPHPYGGFGVVLGALALVVALSLVAGSGGNRTAGSRLRWFFLMLVLAGVGVVVVAAATVFSIEAASGVPLRGGIGDTQVHPTTTGQLASNYRLAMGNLTVDLTDVPFKVGTTKITTSVGIGRLVVEVPPGPTVSVVAHSGLGDVQVFGQDNSGFSTVQTLEAGGTGRGARRHIVVTADTGVGQVQVVRMAPAFS